MGGRPAFRPSDHASAASISGCAPEGPEARASAGEICPSGGWPIHHPRLATSIPGPGRGTVGGGTVGFGEEVGSRTVTAPRETSRSADGVASRQPGKSVSSVNASLLSDGMSGGGQGEGPRALVTVPALAGGEGGVSVGGGRALGGVAVTWACSVFWQAGGLGVSVKRGRRFGK